MDTKLSLNAHNILTRIAGGLTYEQILRDLPHLSRQDIFSAASEVLMILGIDPLLAINAPLSPTEAPAESDNSDDFSAVIIQPGN